MKRYKLILGYSIFIIIMLSVIVGPFIYNVNPNTVNMIKIENAPDREALLEYRFYGKGCIGKADGRRERYP